MPFVEQDAPYLNPYLCDRCMKGVGLDGLVEVGTQKTKNGPPIPIFGRILCANHAYDNE